MKQILCMKWGSLYGPEYVNRLYAMVSRHTTPPFRVVCLTDDPTGVRDEVDCFDCPTVDVPKPYDDWGWRKVAVWGETVADLAGDVLFLDLDVAVVGSLDRFFEFEGRVCIMRNWTQLAKDTGNTSVFRFPVGRYPELLERMQREWSEVFNAYDNEQDFVTAELRRDVRFWPDPWCRAFKVHCLPPVPLRWFREPVLPPDTSVVVFTGRPLPHEAVEGRWPAPWYKKFYKCVRPAGWLREHWR